MLKEDVFDIRSTPVVRTEAIPDAVACLLLEGIVFKVQIGAFKSGISKDAFGELTPMTGETVGNGFVRYLAVCSPVLKAQRKPRIPCVKEDTGDAFVVAYKDGKRIPCR